MPQDEHARPVSPPSVSVIIPTFDRPQLLARALRAVMEQTSPPLEIIVVDNGRTAVDRIMLPPSVRVERTAPAIGVSAARNHGARLARGDLVAFLDDDDTWSPSYLEALVASYRQTGAQVCVAQLLRIRQGETAAEPFKMFPDDPADQRAVFFSNPGLVGSNFLIERPFLSSLGGFDPATDGSEDRDLTARVLLSGGRIVACRQAMAYLHEDAAVRSEPRHALSDTMFLVKHWYRMRPGETGRAALRIARLVYRKLFR